VPALAALLINEFYFTPTPRLVDVLQFVTTREFYKFDISFYC